VGFLVFGGGSFDFVVFFFFFWRRDLIYICIFTEKLLLIGLVN